MIYTLPNVIDAIDQGDIIDDCPLTYVGSYLFEPVRSLVSNHKFQRIIVLTQTCDLAQGRYTSVNLAEVVDAQVLVDRKIVKTADVKGPLRAGRIWGLYFLPASSELGLQEMIIDLRKLHTGRLDLLGELVIRGHRKARLLTPYREHFAKHFAETFSRIGLPRPYETL